MYKSQQMQGVETNSTLAIVGTHLGATNNAASKIALAMVPMMANKMALTPRTVLSTSPKMMVMFSGWLSRVCTQEEQDACGCQHERFTLLTASIFDFLEVSVLL